MTDGGETEREARRGAYQAALARRVLRFYLGRPGADGGLAQRQIWFRSTPDFDAEIRRLFLGDWEAAAAGRLDALATTPVGGLALIVVLDQFPRNMFRRRGRAFASDAKARHIATAALGRGFDAGLQAVERLFMYLPFEHSEDMADQERSVALFPALGNETWTDSAVRHRDIIARFGRFPHRNAALGRASTPQELAFLLEPDSSF
jgi:uncharacterized protein (DUF924 family)